MQIAEENFNVQVTLSLLGFLSICGVQSSGSTVLSHLEPKSGGGGQPRHLLLEFFKIDSKGGTGLQYADRLEHGSESGRLN